MTAIRVTADEADRLSAILPTMSRGYALLLSFVLLFQTSWAVAATYCLHDTSPAAATHFGHHAHVHESAADAEKQAASTLTVDDDCGFCHATQAALPAVAFGGAMVRATGTGDFPSPLIHRSTTDRAPDRPQWPRLA